MIPGEWIRSVHPGERDFCHKSFVGNFGASLIPLDAMRVVDCVHTVQSNTVADLRGHGPRPMDWWPDV